LLHGRRNSIFTNLESSGINSKSSSLMGTEISLIARFNSLLGRKRFPVRVRRKLGRKRLMVLPVLPSLSAAERSRRRVFPSRAREEPRESRVCLVYSLTPSGVLAENHPKNRGFVGILRGQKC